jgi:hypothetical protein
MSYFFLSFFGFFFSLLSELFPLAIFFLLLLTTKIVYHIFLSKKKAPPRVNATVLCYCDSNEIGVNQYLKLPNGVSRSTLFSFPPQE